MTIPKTMKALIMTAPGVPMSIGEVPTPSPAKGEVLVKIEACGVCHTDELYWRVGPPTTTFPHILGHEGAGTVAVLGEGVTNWNVGDRVSVPMHHGQCGECSFCLEGFVTQCAQKKWHAGEVWGCFAEYAVTSAETIVKLADNVSFEKAGPCGCAGVTVTGAIRRANVPKGGWIGFSGAGGLGLMGVQVAKALGYKTLAIDIDDGKLAEAKKLGADVVVNAATAPADKGGLPGAVIAQTDGKGLHALLVVTTAASAFESSWMLVRGGGTVVFIGVTMAEVKYMPVVILSKEIKIMGSLLGSTDDAKTVLDLVATGKVHPLTSGCKLSEVPHVFEELEKGLVTGRKVVTQFV
ncbi:alcohol dehydrogenase GroES domain-containing protein [Gonapodya prolifera JEL478]|uniref:Alcohol dehydrogenase GroES domain-containing protein n=1 Tax=Gonapodya prolifera (strain JEL478) TaxID=1344416 RepID=A0A139AD71_GONPJ|nr:alcohol dehydrogenase GroES domain-containing protein [Gonapodya prolifera JEL478]|eukprot:KXS14762.1 alcohol dehydrogenase GroES domain-containing protein [Gonapodya prolifera JEL478]